MQKPFKDLPRLFAKPAAVKWSVVKINSSTGKQIKVLQAGLTRAEAAAAARNANRMNVKKGYKDYFTIREENRDSLGEIKGEKTNDGQR